MASDLSRESILRGLTTAIIGRNILYHPTVSSTMDVAREAAVGGAPEGTIIVAEEQTSGRGRLGRSWTNPPGVLAVSIIIRPEMSRLLRLGMVASLATSRCVDSATGLKSVIKWPNDVLLRGKKISGILMGLADVSEDAEELYESYSRTYTELQEKVKQVRESRRKVMEEIDERTKRWLEVMRTLLDEVNSRYKSLLSMLQATGEVRLVDTRDIEEAGLEIWVGYKGAIPTRLDPYTHSGGERSASVMAFLLALQQNIVSPFRAVDEFDLHMDPKNKEVVSEFIVKTMEGSAGQYIAITPSQITFKGDGIHVILVHKTEGASTVRVVE